MNTNCRNILTTEEFGKISTTCREALERLNPTEEQLLNLLARLCVELISTADNAIDELAIPKE